MLDLPMFPGWKYSRLCEQGTMLTAIYFYRITLSTQQRSPALSWFSTLETKGWSKLWWSPCPSLWNDTWKTTTKCQHFHNGDKTTPVPKARGLLPAVGRIKGDHKLELQNPGQVCLRHVCVSREVRGLDKQISRWV
jgi:hypothetical protein